MNILILIIYSENYNFYKNMLDIQRKYIHNYENVDVYFVKNSFLHNEEIFIDGDMVHIRGNEDHLNILNKTVLAMEYILYNNKKNYDFIIRGNISTIINIPLVKIELEKYINYNNFYGGAIAGIQINNKNIMFALGTAILMSKNVAKIIVDDKYHLDHNIADDVALGLIVQERLPDSFNHDFTLTNLVFYTNKLEKGFNSTLEDVIEYQNINNDLKDFLFYRNSTGNRYEDGRIMDYFVSNII